MVKALAMTHTDNSSFLAQANARRHQAALSAARHAIEQLQRQGKPVNFSAIAQSAGVSRGWLYRQDQIRDIIGRLRRLDPPAARITAQRASAESLRQRLEAARAEITRLRAENHSLREQIARHIGLQRTGNQTQPSRRDTATTSPHGPGDDMSTPTETPIYQALSADDSR
jgi:regulator of replication initiation timing